MSNEIKVGLTVVGALLIAFFGFRFMRDVPLLRQSNEIYAKFARVDGLNAGSQVLINGVKIGSVKNVSLAEDSDSVRVTMTINVGNTVQKGAIAYLRPIDMLGSKAIVIQRGSGEEVPFGGRIEGRYVESMVETLKDKGEDIGDDLSGTFKQLNTLLEQMNEVTGEGNRREVKAVLENVRSTSQQLNDLIKEKRGDVDASLTKVNSILSEVDTLSANSRPKVDRILTQLERTTQELEGVSGDLSSSMKKLDSILGRLDSGEGTLGKMMQDSSLYHNMDSLSYELHKLTKQLNEDPKSYLKHLKLFSIF
jgi:phospholipid/cholesterol/gamma-HCH transport system substrate-binding protein